jgi:hypothetical protein
VSGQACPSSENQQQNNDDDQHGDNAAADIHNYLLGKIDDSFPIVLDQLKSSALILDLPFRPQQMPHEFNIVK